MATRSSAGCAHEGAGSGRPRESSGGGATKVLPGPECAGSRAGVSFEGAGRGASTIKILIVDDHALIREALRGVLDELDAGARIVEAGTARQATQRIGEHPDLALIVLDLTLPDRDGFELLPEWRERFPAISIVVLSASGERGDVVRALELGVSGFIPKTVSRDVIVRAFELIFAGGVYIPAEALPHPPPPPRAETARDDLPGEAIEALGITERQRDVLALMMRGMSNKAICRELDIAEATVKNHVTSILRALHARNRTEAVIAAGTLVAQARRRR